MTDALIESQLEAPVAKSAVNPYVFEPLDPKDVVKTWPSVRAYILATLPTVAMSDDPDAENKLLDCFEENRLQLWRMRWVENGSKERTLGGVVTKLMTEDTTGARSCGIYSAWMIETIPEEMILQALHILNGFADANGCNWIVANSTLPAMWRAWTKAGGDIHCRFLTLEVQHGR